MEEPSVRRKLTIEAYQNGLINCEYDEMNQDEVAAKLGVCRQTLWDWGKKLDWDYIKEERRKRYASQIIKIDQAMLKKAQKGGDRAAEIMYQRFDGWEPTNIVKSKEVKLTDKELDEEIEKEKAKAKDECKSEIKKPETPEAPQTTE
jgi:hypothetical protein